MEATSMKMTNVQLELLKMFSYNLEESQLFELKELLSKYFISKIDSEIEKIWNQKEWSNATMESLAKRGLR